MYYLFLNLCSNRKPNWTRSLKFTKHRWRATSCRRRLPKSKYLATWRKSSSSIDDKKPTGTTLWTRANATPTSDSIRCSRSFKRKPRWLGGPPPTQLPQKLQSPLSLAQERRNNYTYTYLIFTFHVFLNVSIWCCHSSYHIWLCVFFIYLFFCCC